MTRVDFYMLEQRSAEIERFACRLTEKAWRLGHQIYLQTKDAEQTDRIDRLLWTFRDQAFIPHGKYGEPEAADLRVALGHGTDPTGWQGLLINLDDEVPTFFSRFDRVAEIVGPGAEEREVARQRYNFYQERGYTLHRHTI